MMHKDVYEYKQIMSITLESLWHGMWSFILSKLFVKILLMKKVFSL